MAQRPSAVQDWPTQPTAGVPRWDDSLDEEIAQVGQQLLYAQQRSYVGADVGGLVQYGIEQMQQDLEGNSL